MKIHEINYSALLGLLMLENFLGRIAVQSPEYWCRDGECPDDLHCFGVAGLCNIQDLVRESIEKGEEVNVDYEAIKEYEESKKQQDDDDKPEYRDDDPKRSNFCGSKCTCLFLCSLFILYIRIARI